MALRAFPLLCLLGGLLAPLLLMLPMEGRALHGEAPPPQAWLQEATVTIAPSRCAGALVGDGSVVATVAHCVRGDRAQVQLRDGRRLEAEVFHRDATLDRLLLRLPEAAGALPLRIRSEAALPGEQLFFGGFHRSPGSELAPLQRLEVLRIGPCPSLPKAPALHTSLVAKKGDSGSPLVSEEGALVGMVHGGARCQIATPAHGLELLLDEERP